MVDAKLIESLLYQSEGTAIDFKRDQYLFIDATENESSELLKDVLAFANSWRQGDAYILIGVKAVASGRHVPVGIRPDEHFDDAQLQQFVNYKTNRPIEMAYESVVYEGISIGVIRIVRQKRPFYSKKNYGKVKKEIIYYRQGSSTAIAKPEDVARMGEDVMPSHSSPELILQLANCKKRQQLGASTHISSIAYAVPTHPLPDLSPPSTNFGVTGYSETSFNRPNRNYLRQKEEFIRLNHLCKPIGFVLYNSSRILAKQVKVEIKGSCAEGIQVFSDLPEEPERTEFMSSIPTPSRSLYLPAPMISVESYDSQWTATLRFGDVQPKSTVWLDESLYIGSSRAERFEPDVLIFADNLPEPQKVDLVIDFSIEAREKIDPRTLNMNLTRY